MTGAGHPAVQRLQFFLSESRWDHEQVNARRLELLLADPATAPHGGGVLVIDDSGEALPTSSLPILRAWQLGRRTLGRSRRSASSVSATT